MEGETEVRSSKSRPGRTMRRSGIVLAALGLLGLVFAAVAGYVGMSSVSTVVATGRGEVVISGTGAVSLDAGEDRQLYRNQGMLTPECFVTDPNGEPAVPGVAQSSSITSGGRQWQSFDSFRAGPEGEYQIACQDGEVLVAPPLSISGIFMGIGGMLLSVFAGLIGAALLASGLILFFIGRFKLRQGAPPPGATV